MASADFSQFVVTTHFFMRLRDLPGYSHVLSLFTRRIYRKRFRVAIGLCFVVQTCPRFRPYMRFLFVRPEFCPLGDLSTPNIRLSSDSTSRWTPLSLAKPSHYRATSGLSPYRTCAHRAHTHNPETAVQVRFPDLYCITGFHRAGSRRSGFPLDCSLPKSFPHVQV